MSAPVLGTCFGFNEDYVDFARKSISDAMFKFSSEIQQSFNYGCM